MTQSRTLEPPGLYFQCTTRRPAAEYRVAQACFGQLHRCVRTDQGDVYCWGFNSEGQLGIDSDELYVASPRLVESLEGVADLQCGPLSVCARLNNGSLWCWGNNASGNLGTGSADTPVFRPTKVVDIPHVREFQTRDTTSCAIDVDGSVWCWGSNTTNTLASFDGVRSYSPVEVEFP